MKKIKIINKCYHLEDMKLFYLIDPNISYDRNIHDTLCCVFNNEIKDHNISFFTIKHFRENIYHTLLILKEETDYIL